MERTVAPGPNAPSLHLSYSPSLTLLNPTARAIQFWDKSRILSDHLLRTARDEWGHFSDGEEVEAGSIVWDYVLVFPPDTEWDESLAPPDFAGGPVVMVIDEVRSRLSRLTVK